MANVTYDDQDIDRLFKYAVDFADLVPMALLTGRSFCPAAIGCPTLVNGTSYAANTIRATPFRVIQPYKLTQLSLYLVSGGGLLSSVKFRFALFKADTTTLMPKELLWQSVEITQTATNADYALSGLSVALPKGVYYFAVLTNGSAQFRGFTAQLQDNFLLYQNSSQTSPIVAVQAAYVYSAFPASFPATFTLVNGSAVMPDFFMFKIASL